MQVRTMRSFEPHLSKAGCVHRLRVVLLTEVKVMHVEGTSGDTHTFSYFIVVL